MFTVNCTWGDWSSWEDCSVTCAGGTQGRNRSIDVPAEYGGNDCTGNEAETQACNIDGCPGRAFSVLMFTIRQFYSILIFFQNIHSQLCMGCVDCMGRLLCNMWWWNSGKE